MVIDWAGIDAPEPRHVDGAASAKLRRCCFDKHLSIAGNCFAYLVKVVNGPPLSDLR